MYAYVSVGEIVMGIFIHEIYDIGVELVLIFRYILNSYSVCRATQYKTYFQSCVFCSTLLINIFWNTNNT